MRANGARLTWVQLVNLIGPSAAEALAVWAGHRLPSPGPVRRAERIRRILAAIDAGEPYSAVADREGVTRGRVAQICKRPV